MIEIYFVHKKEILEGEEKDLKFVHGLRDFYYTIKYASFRYKKEEEKILD